MTVKELRDQLADADEASEIIIRPFERKAYVPISRFTIRELSERRGEVWIDAEEA